MDNTTKKTFLSLKELTKIYEFAIISLEPKYRKRVRRKVGVKEKIAPLALWVRYGAAV